MSSERDGIRRFTTDDVGTWHKSERGGVFLSDVVDATNGDSMSVGFARYEPRASNEWVVTYDEALITTRGVFTVTSEDGVTTAAEAGEVIFLTRGTPVVYAAGDAGADIVYVTYPHWMDAQQASEQAALLATFTPIEGAPPPTHRELLRRAWGPLERGESDDMAPVFDLLAEDVVFKTPVGELRGKEQVMGYFAHGPAVMEFDPFVRPPEYFGDAVSSALSSTFGRRSEANHSDDAATAKAAAPSTAEIKSTMTDDKSPTAGKSTPTNG